MDDEESWRLVLARVRNVFELEADAPALKKAVEQPPVVSDVARDFSFEDLPEDKAHFRYPHIEPLLEETAGLLDRALAERNIYFQFSEAFFKAKQEVIEFLRLDSIHDEERQAHIYTVPYEETKSILEAEMKLDEADNRVTTHYSAIEERYTADGIERQADVSGAVAHNASLPFYYSSTDENEEVKRRHRRSFERFGINGFGQDTAAYSLAKLERKTVLEIEEAYLRLAITEHEATKAARRERIKGLSFKASYLQKDVDFRTRRSDVAKELVRIRIAELCRPDGALNYYERMKSIKSRVFADLREAHARIKAVADGLEKIYGIALELPDPQSGVFLDDAVAWVRNVGHKLTRLSRLDQNYVFRASIGSRLTEEQFQAGLEVSWKFNLEPDDFPAQCLTRIRGLSVFSIDESGNLYQLNVRVPRQAQILHAGEVQLKQLDQNEIPRCWFGRVGSRFVIRDPDLSGVQALHNCSPIGQWEVELAPAMRSVAKRGGLKDIELDIYLAVQQTPSGG